MKKKKSFQTFFKYYTLFAELLMLKDISKCDDEHSYLNATTLVDYFVEIDLQFVTRTPVHPLLEVLLHYNQVRKLHGYYSLWLSFNRLQDFFTLMRVKKQ